jgi:hypothetical protein
MFVTLKKVIHYIQVNIRNHENNGHRFRRRGRVHPENRVLTELDINEVVLLILEHLDLVIDEDFGTLITTPKKACDHILVVAEEVKKVITIEVNGVVHLSTSKIVVGDHVVRPITDITCPHCLEVLKGGVA